MKIKVITLFIGAAIWLFFISASSGYAAINDEGITGAPGDEMNGVNPKTCQYCHSAGAFGPPTMTIQFFDSTGTSAVSSYLPNKRYTIRTTITAGSGTPSGYGFQMIDIRKSNSANVKGFLASNQQNTGIQITTLMKNGRQYAEHDRKSTSNTFNVKWRAPATSGLGTITFYAAGNAVNGNGDLTGDGATFKNAELPEGRVATNDLREDVQIKLFTEGGTIIVQSPDTRSVRMQMTDLSGRVVLADTWRVTHGENQKTFNFGHLNKGIYLFQLIDNQSLITKKVIKL